jgi:hypothetical protein
VTEWTSPLSFCLGGSNPGGLVHQETSQHLCGPQSSPSNQGARAEVAPVCTAPCLAEWQSCLSSGLDMPLFLSCAVQPPRWPEGLCPARWFLLLLSA